MLFQRFKCLEAVVKKIRKKEKKKKKQLVFKWPHMYLRTETKRDLQIVMLNIAVPTSFMDRTENTEPRT